MKPPRSTGPFRLLTIGYWRQRGLILNCQPSMMPRSARAPAGCCGGTRHARAPRGFRIVLDTAHLYSRQIHLEQGHLDRALTPPIVLNDRRLKGRSPKLGGSSNVFRRPSSSNCACSGRREYHRGPRCALHSDDISQRAGCAVVRRGSFYAVLIAFGHLQFSQI